MKIGGNVLACTGPPSYPLGRLSFSPFLLSFFPHLFSFSPFLLPFCSLDAAKRKAWKLNRVGSLRNVYSGNANTEGNTCPSLSPPLSLLSLHVLPLLYLHVFPTDCTASSSVCVMSLFFCCSHFQENICSFIHY